MNDVVLEEHPVPAGVLGDVCQLGQHTRVGGGARSRELDGVPHGIGNEHLPLVDVGAQDGAVRGGEDPRPARGLDRQPELSCREHALRRTRPGAAGASRKRKLRSPQAVC